MNDNLNISGRDMLAKTISNIFFFLIALALFGALRSSNLDIRSIPPQYVLLIVGILALVLVLLFVRRVRAGIVQICGRLYRTFARHKRIFVAAVVLLVLAYQVYALSVLMNWVGWDVGRIHSGIFGEDTSDIHTYLSYYPNNIFYFFLMKGYGSLWPAAWESWLLWDILNILAIDLGVLFTVLAARRRFGNAAGIYTLLLGVIVMALSPWMLIPYTDTMVWPFVSGSLLLLAYYRRDFSVMRQVLWGVLLALLMYASYLMKPSAVVLLPAALIVELFFALRQRKSYPWKKAVSFFAVFLCVFLLSNMLWGVFLDRQEYVRIDREKSMSLLHYYMMGLNDNGELQGAWSGEDTFGSQEQPSYEDRLDFNKRVISERLRAFGVDGYLKFLLLKYEDNTKDGTFNWGKEGSFMGEYVSGDESYLAYKLKEFFYPGGRLIGLYHFCAQIIWIVFLVILLFARKERGYYANLLRLAVIGGLVFLLLSEAGRSRYLIQYLPMLLILGGTGMHSAKKILRLGGSMPAMTVNDNENMVK